MKVKIYNKSDGGIHGYAKSCYAHKNDNKKINGFSSKVHGPCFCTMSTTPP